jgi:hypothetical protein
MGAGVAEAAAGAWTYRFTTRRIPSRIARFPPVFSVPARSA